MSFPRWQIAALSLLLLLICHGRATSADAPAAELALFSVDIETGNQSPLPCDVEWEAEHPAREARSYSFLWENLSFFGGTDGSKEPEDLGVNARFGMRGAVNWGVPLFEDYGVGVQAGTALNYSNNAVRVLRTIDGTHETLQSFTTIGLFQRTEWGINWGAVYDFRFDDYYQNLSFGQWRGQIGYNVGDNDEVGVRATVRDHGQDASIGAQSFRLRPINQSELFWRHIWANDVVTNVWVGLAEGHGRFVFVNPGESPTHTAFAFGGEFFVPLTDRLAIFAEANFITPNDSGTVDATLGLAFFPGAGARRAPRSRFAPLLPLGNNSSFAVDLRR
jgi:hypothetical protein